MTLDLDVQGEPRERDPLNAPRGKVRRASALTGCHGAVELESKLRDRAARECLSDVGDHGLSDMHPGCHHWTPG